MSLSIRSRLERRGELGARDSDTTCHEKKLKLIGRGFHPDLQVIVCKVEVGETGQAGQGVGGQGDDGVVGEVEGGERVQS